MKPYPVVNIILGYYGDSWADKIARTDAIEAQAIGPFWVHQGMTHFSHKFAVSHAATGAVVAHVYTEAAAVELAEALFAYRAYFDTVTLSPDGRVRLPDAGYDTVAHCVRTFVEADEYAYDLENCRKTDNEEK